MQIDIWTITNNVIATLPAVLLAWVLQRWFSGPNRSWAKTKPNHQESTTQRQKDIRRSILWPAYAISLGSLGMLVWKSWGSEPVRRNEVVLFIGYFFMFVVGLGLMAVARIVAALDRVMERRGD